MIAVIDTVFSPVLNWLNALRDYLLQASVPVSRPIEFANVFSPFAMLGSWSVVVSNIFVMVFVYCIVYVVSNGIGVLESFRNVIKWW